MHEITTTYLTHADRLCNERLALLGTTYYSLKYKRIWYADSNSMCGPKFCVKLQCIEFGKENNDLTICFIRMT